MIGRTYLERGKPVVVLKRWGQIRWDQRQVFGRTVPLLFWKGFSKDAPRNVLILRSDGSCVVRPFRGLRKTEEMKT